MTDVKPSIKKYRVNMEHAQYYDLIVEATSEEEAEAIAKDKPLTEFKRLFKPLTKPSDTVEGSECEDWAYVYNAEEVQHA